jgi:EAL domain-containing protein (putative c-di-GMP-specific phosphodiesterase class I)
MLRTEASSVEDLLDRRHLMPTYQPIFDLTTGEAVGAEALARWPALDVTPDKALRRAAREGRLAELDRACREAAIDDAIDHGLPEGFCLFVNLEPSVLAADTAELLVAQAGDRVRLVVEITERSILGRPAELLHVVRRLRAAGCAIALDDVGPSPTPWPCCPSSPQISSSWTWPWSSAGRTSTGRPS